MLDVLIVGGGHAGLSAALVLGRARRSVVVLDQGTPRNTPAAGVHGFLSRDGTLPAELLAAGRAQLEPYASVSLRPTAAQAAQPTADGFAVQLADGTTLHARRLLLASGVTDELPPVAGMAERWGASVFHCPYCHGWEVRDEPLAVYGRGWSRDLVLCTDGPAQITDDERAALARNEVGLREERILRLDGPGTSLEQIVFETGAALPRRGLFLHPAQTQRSALPAQLGCAFTVDSPLRHLIKVDMFGQTSVPGVYAAGDAATPMQQAIAAAAGGGMAAAAINRELLTAEWR